MVGNRENILSILGSRIRIIHEDKIGGASIIAIFDTLSEEQYEKLKENHIEVSQLPLQKLFVYLTAEKEGEE